MTSLQDVIRDAARTVLRFDAILLAIYDPLTDSLNYLDSYDDGILDPCVIMPLAGTPASRVIHERRTLMTSSSTATAAQGSRIIGTGRRSGVVFGVAAGAPAARTRRPRTSIT